MTIYDAVMAGIVIAGLVWGALRGITWQVASIASLVLGYAVAFPLSGQLAPHFPGEPVVARGLAMLTVYIVTSGGIHLVAWLIRATLRTLKFEAYDRHLGMILGGLEGALLGMVGTLFVLSLSPQSRQPILSSPAGKLVSVTMKSVQPLLPGEIRAMLTPFWSDASATSTQSETAAHDPNQESTVRTWRTPSESDAGAAANWLGAEKNRVGHAVVEAAEGELKQLGDSNDRETLRR